MTVTGTGSTWTNTGNLYLDGTLSIAAGAQVSDAYAYVPSGTGSTGSVTVSGSNSRWAGSGPLYVGYAGQATLRFAPQAAVVPEPTLLPFLAAVAMMSSLRRHRQAMGTAETGE